MNTGLYDKYLYHRRNFRSKASTALEKARKDETKRYAVKHSSGMTRTYELPESYYQERFFEHLEDGGFRLVGYCDEISYRIGHTGWFIDVYQDDKYRGAVVQIPGANGQERFMVGYEESSSNGFVIDLHRIFEDKTEAAYAADSYAEREAEDAREYNEAWQAGSRYSDLLGDAKQAKKDFLALVTELRTLRKESRDKGIQASETVCSVLRGELEHLRQSYKDALEKAKELKDEYTPGYQGKLRGAFNEGAGMVVIA